MSLALSQTPAYTARPVHRAVCLFTPDMSMQEMQLMKMSKTSALSKLQQRGSRSSVTSSSPLPATPASASSSSSSSSQSQSVADLVSGPDSLSVVESRVCRQLMVDKFNRVSTFVCYIHRFINSHTCSVAEALEKESNCY